MSSFKNQKSFYWVRPDALNPNAIPKQCNADDKVLKLLHLGQVRLTETKGMSVPTCLLNSIHIGH